MFVLSIFLRSSREFEGSCYGTTALRRNGSSLWGVLGANADASKQLEKMNNHSMQLLDRYVCHAEPRMSCCSRVGELSVLNRDLLDATTAPATGQLFRTRNHPSRWYLIVSGPDDPTT